MAATREEIERLEADLNNAHGVELVAIVQMLVYVRNRLPRDSHGNKSMGVVWKCVRAYMGARNLTMDQLGAAAHALDRATDTVIALDQIPE